MKHKIYCFVSTRFTNDMTGLAVGHDGCCLANHTSSNEDFLKCDLGMNGSNRKHDQYDAHFGPGNWELEWIPDPDNHAGLKEAHRLHRALIASARPQGA